jgi:hypothetical protein
VQGGRGLFVFPKRKQQQRKQHQQKQKNNNAPVVLAQHVDLRAVVQPHVGDDANKHVARLELAERQPRVQLAVGADAVLLGRLWRVVGVGEARLLLRRLGQPLLARPPLCAFFGGRG